MEGVTINSDGQGRPLVTFPSSETQIEQIKRVPGRWWIPDQRMWSVPDTPEVRAALAEIFAAPLPRSIGECIGATPPKPETEEATREDSRSYLVQMAQSWCVSAAYCCIDSQRMRTRVTAGSRQRGQRPLHFALRDRVGRAPGVLSSIQAERSAVSRRTPA